MWVYPPIPEMCGELFGHVDIDDVEGFEGFVGIWSEGEPQPVGQTAGEDVIEVFGRRLWPENAALCLQVIDGEVVVLTEIGAGSGGAGVSDPEGARADGEFWCGDGKIGRTPLEAWVELDEVLLEPEVGEIESWVYGR